MHMNAKALLLALGLAWALPALVAQTPSPEGQTALHHADLASSAWTPMRSYHLDAGSTRWSAQGYADPQYQMQWLHAGILLNAGAAQRAHANGAAFHQYMLDLGLGAGIPNLTRSRTSLWSFAPKSIWQSWLAQAHVGLSATHRVGKHGQLLWRVRGRLSKLILEEWYYRRPSWTSIGPRVHGAAGYAQAVSPNLMWFAGGYLGYDDRMWMPIPWAGMQWAPNKRHRLLVLLPKTVEYRYRFDPPSANALPRWELGTKLQTGFTRYGHRKHELIWGTQWTRQVDSLRANTSLWTAQLGI